MKKEIQDTELSQQDLQEDQGRHKKGQWVRRTLLGWNQTLAIQRHAEISRREHCVLDGCNSSFRLPGCGILCVPVKLINIYFLMPVIAHWIVNSAAL
jgi:hypothetical protein